MRFMTVWCGALCALGVLLAGCGGGSNADVQGDSLRRVQAGDVFTYQVHTHVGEMVYDDEVTWTFTAQTGYFLANTPNDMYCDYLAYTATGALQCFADAGTGEPAASPTFTLPKQLVPGVNILNDALLHNVEPLSGPLSITVPAGTFSVYKFVFNEYDGSTRATQVFVSPQLGMIVKVIDIDGDYYEKTQELTSYQLAP